MVNCLSLLLERQIDDLLRLRNRHLAFVDLYSLPMVAVLAFLLYLDSADLRPYALTIWMYALAAPLIKIPILYLMGLYNRLWSCASILEARIIISAAGAAALAQGLLFLALVVPLEILPSFPRAVILIDALVSIVAVAAPRFLVRLGAQRSRGKRKPRDQHVQVKRVLVVGAAHDGQMVLRELEAKPEVGWKVVGFVDDDPEKQAIYVHDRRVLGTTAALPALIQKHAVDAVVIAMPGAPGRTVRSIVDICKHADVEVRIMPGYDQLLSGQVVPQIRNLQIEDLLRREPVQTDTREVAQLVRGRRVLVTGAGGSIGSELCRQIAAFGPAQLLLLGHGENSIFTITNEVLRLRAGGAVKYEVHPIIADLRDRERLNRVFSRWQPELVFHAAAHKHVPLMEVNVEDAVTNNILGTRRLIDACVQAGVMRFVLISSDKAVNPSSIMGATKRVAELIVQQAALRTGRCYVAVRFGNVLGSRGSVVPLFQRQIAEGGPVTVTHPEMRRYFMTIPEAVQLVLQASALGHGGEVFVLDMGQPVRIVDLAEDLIRLSGLQPTRDIEISFTGLRPGEKLFEEIFAGGEPHSRTVHQKIFVCRNGASAHHVPQDLDTQLERLLSAAISGDVELTRELLRVTVPEYCHPADGEEERV